MSLDLSLEGKTAFVTGGTRGIGRHIALTLAKAGCGVAVCGTHEERLRNVEAELLACGIKAKSYKLNITEESEVTQVFQNFMTEFGGLDVLVNNAGITRDSLLIRMSVNDWQEVMEVNLKGMFLCARAATKQMMKKRQGRIINISSVSSLMASPGQANYSASKAGVIGFTRSLAKELAGRNVLVNAIAPGFIETEMTKVVPENEMKKITNNIPLGRLGQPQDVANMAVFLSGEASKYITGQVFVVDGGISL